jgi:predicted amidohydrolase
MIAMTTLRVALVQLDADDEVAANIERATILADRAAAGGADLVALPEYLHFRGSDEGFRASAAEIPGPYTEPFAEIARRRGCWVLAGSSAERSDDPERPWNTSVLIDPDGRIAATYRKVHLFDVAVDQGPVDTESARVSPGSEIVTAQIAPDSVIGMTICYDLRFPELYQALALRGANILAVPAAFTERTGRDHWEVLLRARAIENGAWVIAPAQVGGPPNIKAYGHAMVVDPWGIVVARASDGVGIVRAEIDTDRVAAVRRQIPSLANRRPEVFAREREAISS